MKQYPIKEVIMQCKEAENIIEELFEKNNCNALSNDFEQHIKKCHKCLIKFENMKKVKDLTADYPKLIPKADIVSKIMSNIKVLDEKNIKKSQGQGRKDLLKMANNKSNNDSNNSSDNNKNYTPFYIIGAIAAAILFIFILPKTSKKQIADVTNKERGAFQCAITDFKGFSTIYVPNHREKIVTGNEKLYSGTLLTTTKSADVSVKYSDNTILKIKELSEIKFKFNSFVMKKGSTWLNVTKKESKFVIETPVAVLGVLGTCFDVIVEDNGKTRVDLHQGSLKIDSQKKTAKNSSVILKAGHSVIINENFEIEPPVSMSKGFELFDTQKNQKKKSTWNK